MTVTTEGLPALTPDLNSLLAALPKIDLHRHLEGSIRLSTLSELAREYQIDVPTYDPESLRPYVQVMPNVHASANNFLAKFQFLRQFYRTPEAIRRIAREVVEDAAADNIKYLELRFTPKALSKLRNFSFAEVIQWVCQAVDEAQKANNIQVRLIVSLNRHESPREGELIIRTALDYCVQGVVGLDLAGQESGYPASPFIEMFAEAHRAGLEITIHAGEWSGPRNIRDAIQGFGAMRIGHGVRIIEDSSVTQLARDLGTALEVCLTSNVHSGVVYGIEQHPLRDMNYLGLRTTLNTDDPAVSNITLTQEFRLAMDTFGMSLDDIKRTIITSAQSAFLPPDERAKLVAYFTEALKK